MKHRWLPSGGRACAVTAVLTTLLSAFSASNGAVHAASIQKNEQLIEKLASVAISSDPTYLGRPRLRITRTQVRFDTMPVPLEDILGSKESLALPLEALIRAHSMQRDFRRELPLEKFWVDPLAAIQRSAREYARTAPKTSDANVAAGFSQVVQRATTTLSARLEFFATRHGLELITERKPAEGFDVTVRIEPSSGRIQVIPLLLYKKAKLTGETADDQWRELFVGTVSLVGQYRYRAEWPALRHVEESTFEIREASNLTFRDHAQ